MNERIDRFAKECFGSLDAYSLFDYEKFARLIVEDCLAALEGQRECYANPGNYGTNSYYDRMDAKECAIHDAMDLIRYRFGVK